MTIEFSGRRSPECAVDLVRRRAKTGGTSFLIATLIGFPFALLGIIYGGIIFESVAFILVMSVVTIVAYIPPVERAKKFRCETRLVVENGMIEETIADDPNTQRAKPISRVKKIYDCGEWYYIIFRFGDMTNAWVAEKKLLTKGTLEAFEEIFNSLIFKC